MLNSKSSMAFWRLLLGLLVVHFVASSPVLGPLFRLPHDVLEMDEECKDERSDCSWLVNNANEDESLEEYCLRNRQNTAVKQCAKTCNFCKPPAQEECKDERSDCSWLVNNANEDESLEEYCLRNRQNTAVKQCAKTCNFCKPPAPPAPEVSECKDERSDCSWLVNNANEDESLEEYCLRNLHNTAVKQCAKTCNFCKPPAPEECKDEREDCGWVIAAHAGQSKQTVDEYCEHWKLDPAVKACAKTCNFCKTPSPIGCKDERNCDWILDNTGPNKGETLEEYCETWKNDAAVQQCPKTCRLCE